MEKENKFAYITERKMSSKQLKKLAVNIKNIWILANSFFPSNVIAMMVLFENRSEDILFISNAIL